MFLAKTASHLLQFLIFLKMVENKTSEVKFFRSLKTKTY